MPLPADRRYAVISTGMKVEDIADLVKGYGGSDVVVAVLMRQVFATMSAATLDRVSRHPGLAVKPVGEMKAGDAAAVYGGYVDTVAAYVWQLRNFLSPPITGKGWTVAILDSGIRKTHTSLDGKVVYEENFTASPDASDVFDHGTGVAHCVAGGRPAEGEEQGVVPDAKLVNLKVLSDEGVGTEESVVLAVERAVQLRINHERYTDLHVDLINLSGGAPDDGDPNNPVRVALRTAVFEHQLCAVAAAGNGGPSPGTILSPATDPWVDAVGALTYSPFQVWGPSARGPTLEGVVKPDVVWYGVSRLVASSASNTAFAVKSGTSFAAPSWTGFLVMIREGAERLFGMPYEQLFAALFDSRGGLQYYDNLYKQFCIKPQGEPPNKDNSYGYGLPVGALLARQFAPSATGGDMVNQVMPVFGLALAAPLLMGMARAMRPRR